ncbi:hypothetical protein SAMN02745883_01015 [Caminicella sporogenes DSM 14501]|uniref:DUF3298 domain-containing protein n=1 Tax=Caminicella sporogenes DSM 14501 TaxID=1121266 RepID=A0A1M6NXK5_9FIRM|nr:hypothetical protein [Caminicella sporogenes]RKD21608.1 hypothetical protein BET04_07770 [Caminicella sporogenes]SHK00380.1 hypothetical protein SAMN02745883_01015 [Caminicella sporogenes DSM 14501]
MNLKKAAISTVLIASIALSGCTMGSSNDNKQETDVKKQENSQVEMKETEKLNYSINKETFKDESRNITIYYPQIKEYSGELVMDNINQSLRKIVDTYGKDKTYTDVSIDYEITKSSNDILSVLFKGKGKLTDIGEVNIMQSVNLDVHSSNEINYENFVKDDEAVRKILDKKAKEQGLKDGVEAEGIRVYFKDSDVVFYYMPLDDSAKEFIEVSVPYEEIKEYVNKDFGEKPAS